MKKLVRKLFTPLVTIALAFGVGISLSQQKAEVGVKAAVLTDSISAKGWGGYTNGSFSGVGVDYSATAPTSGATLAMQIFNGSTGAVRGNQSSMTGNFSLRNTTEYPGYIRKITLTVSGGTLTSSSSRSVVSLGDLPFAADYVTSTGAVAADTIGLGNATLTWTIPSGTNHRYFKLHSLQTSGTALAATADAIKIEYEEAAAPVFGVLDSITLDTDAVKKDYIPGNTFNSDGLVVVAHDVNGNFKSVNTFTTDYDSVVITASHVGTKVVTVSYTEASVTKTATYNINVTIPAMLDKVLALANLQFGATYGIADPTTGKVMNTAVTTFFGQYDGTFVADSFSVEEQTQLFTLEIGNQASSFAFKLTNGAKANEYIQLASNANNLTTKATIDDNSSWTITIVDGEATITNVAFPTRAIKYNPGSPRFATYTSGQNAVSLFVETATISDATSVNRLITEINTGRGNSASTQCALLLSVFQGAYNQLTVNGKALFDGSSDAEFVSARNRMAYLEAWVAANPTPAGRPNTTEATNNVAAIVLIGAIGLTTIVGYYFLNKKKLSA